MAGLGGEGHAGVGWGRQIGSTLSATYVYFILAFTFLQFAKTLICQGHLCPLPLHVAPVYWAYDNALRLYPIPDLIVCADKYDPFSESQMDTHVVNPVRHKHLDGVFHECVCV